MKTINLSINERFGIRNMLNEAYQRGGLTLDTLVNSSKISEKCNVEIELLPPDKDGVSYAKGGPEAKAANLRQVSFVQDGKPVTQLMWDVSKSKDKAIEFTSDEVNLLKELISGKSERKELSLSDTYLVALNEKLNKKEE